MSKHTKHSDADDIRPPKAPGTRATEKKPPTEDDRPQHEDEDLSAFVQDTHSESKRRPSTKSDK